MGLRHRFERGFQAGPGRRQPIGGDGPRESFDHTRDFFHLNGVTSDPTNMATTTPILFFTRWITHFCAPVFIFLSGISARLQAEKKSRKELSFFLFTRGIWLVLLEFSLITLGWTFNPLYPFFILQVIWTIGICMIFDKQS